MEVKLKVNEVEVKLGVNAINDLVYSLPDGEEYYDLFHQLSLSNISSIREKIASKDCLSEETVKLLLKDKNSKVLGSLVRSECVKEYATDDDIDHIIKFGDEETIENLISYIDDYENINQSKTIGKIMALENDYLMYQLSRNWDTPKNILKLLKDHNDPDVAKAAKKTLDDC